jgi:hypothetical protein
MRNRIMGGIGVVWGGGVVLYGLFGTERGEGAYGAGQMAAVVFGACMFLAGLYYLIKGDPPDENRPAKRHGPKGKGRR